MEVDSLFEQGLHIGEGFWKQWEGAKDTVIDIDLGPRPE